MTTRSGPLERLAWRALSLADAACNRVYGWRANPLYQSGTVAVLMLAVLLVTGVWLLLFYRIGAPYASVAGVTASPIAGNWVRGVHRYASDLAVFASLAHLLRMFAQGRSWGPRALAWVSGIVLLALVFVCGWTGYVMVWDQFGQLLAREGARMLDALPIFSEPVSRAFTGERPVSNAFFFVNLFAHVALPLGLAVGLWLHVSRVARAALLPPRALATTLVVALVAIAVIRPLTMEPEASAFLMPALVRGDVIYAFWLPLSRALPGAQAVGLGVAIGLALVAVPLGTKRRADAPAPSSIDESICVGCRQCALDCPYEAIQMVPREGGGRSAEVGRVDPSLCVSCGICAGSCAPMGVGPAGRTGRDQLARVRAFLEQSERRPGELIVIGCDRTSAALDPAARGEGATLYPVDCAGSLHTSVIELMIRAGAGGVLVLACPPRDCWNREGPKWVRERMYFDREAELQARVDRHRVRLDYADIHDVAAARAAIAAFKADLARLAAPVPDRTLDVDAACEPAEAEQ